MKFKKLFLCSLVVGGLPRAGAGVHVHLAAARGGTNWHLLSISFDPEWDTPARLASYTSTYRYDHRHWSFVTGALADIRKFGERFGLTFQWTKGTIEHNVRTVVVDTTGRVQKVFADNEWSVAALVEEMK